MREDISNNISIQVDMILTLADPVEKVTVYYKICLQAPILTYKFYKTGSWQTARSIFCSLFCSLGGVPNISARENRASKIHSNAQ